MSDDMKEILGYLKAGKDALDILKTLRSFLPAGQDSDKLVSEISRAETMLAESETMLAKALGYHLCQCTFPPQIMLSKGHHTTHNLELFACASCGKQEPSEHTIREHDAIKAHNDSLRSGRLTWMAR